MVKDVCVLDRNSEEFTNLQKACVIFNEIANKENIAVSFSIKDIYYDFGQDWKYTAIISDDGENSWQTLNPVEWKDICNAGSNNAITDVCLQVLKSFSYTIRRKQK